MECEKTECLLNIDGKCICGSRERMECDRNAGAEKDERN